MTKREFLAYGSQNGLKILHFDGNREVESVHDIMNISHEEIVIFDGEYEYAFPAIEALPIVRPLSDLDKPCLTDNKIPLLELGCATTDPQMVRLWLDKIRTKQIKQVSLEKLIDWHFDILYLIDNKEGVDVNTLEANPYVSPPVF